MGFLIDAVAACYTATSSDVDGWRAVTNQNRLSGWDNNYPQRTWWYVRPSGCAALSLVVWTLKR